MRGSLLFRRSIGLSGQSLRLTRPRYQTPQYAWTAARKAFATSPRHRDPYSDVSMTDRFSMKDKTVLVTGGGRGIGFAICKAVAQLGGNVAVLDSLPTPVDEFHSLGEKYGVKAFYKQADVTQQESLQSGFEDAVSHAGSLQGCVTAAGIALDKPFVDHEWEESQRVLAVNVMGTFWTARLMAEHLLSQKQPGSIVVIASVAAQGIKIPLQNLSVYNMSKAAVKGLVGPLAVELGEYGIRVNSISPGVIESPMTKALTVQYPRFGDMFQNAAPVRRSGRPSDLTPLVAFLLSDASTFTTGSDFVITGGLHAGSSPSWIPK